MNCHVIGHGGERCIPKEMDSGQAPRGRRRLRHHLDDGDSIPGLYGVGNCVASASAQGYWAGGATLGPILTFGHLAAEHATGRQRRRAARQRRIEEANT